MEELLLTGDRDHAIVTQVVKEAQSVIENKDNNGYLGRTALQKILYFVKYSGVEVGYRFQIHYYGPFSEDLYEDVDRLCADYVIKDIVPEHRYSNYVLDRNAEKLLEKHCLNEKDIKLIHEIVEALHPFTPKELELYSTLDYICRDLGSSIEEAAVLSRFKEIKSTKFEEETVKNAFSKMTSVGLCHS